MSTLDCNALLREKMLLVSTVYKHVKKMLMRMRENHGDIEDDASTESQRNKESWQN